MLHGAVTELLTLVSLLVGQHGVALGGPEGG